jgi:hypothetical protein
MCVYCVVGDSWFRHDPPFDPDYRRWPTIPRPIIPAPIEPWPLDKLKEYLDVLIKIKELEDRLGCPCEPNKADYIKIMKDRIAALEKMRKMRGKKTSPKRAR